MKTTQRYKGTHFHFSVSQEGVVCYDYTEDLPMDAIKQYGALAAMVEGNDFNEVNRAVAQFFLKLHNEGGMPAYILNGEFMAEAVFKCTRPCHISPSMN